MTATHLLRYLKEPITRKIVFLVVLLFGALGLLLAQHHVAHVYTSRCQEALDNQHAKRSLGWVIRKKLVQTESALHRLAAEDDARNVRVLREHIAQRVTSIERALTVLSNGGVYEHVIRINFENTDEFRETISYAKDESEGFVIEVVELVPKLVDLECNVEALADAVRKWIVAEDDTSRQALSDMIALRRKQAVATLLRCGETANKIYRDTSQELAAIERRRMDLADRAWLTEYATAGILGLLCVVVAGITLRQVAGIIKERKGLLGDLRKHRDHLDELITVRTSELIEANQQLQQEVTERKQAEEALRESEGRLKALLNANPTGIVVIDAETHEIVDANPVAVKMFGASREQVLGRKCHKYICPAGSGQCPITDLGQEVDNAERVLIRADGEEVPILKTVVPVVLNGRECFLGSFIDITARKQAEEDAAARTVELEQQTIELEKSRRMAMSMMEDAEQARRAAEQARELLAKSDQAFMDSFHASADATLLIEGETFVNCNERAVAMLRASNQEEVLATHPSELSPETQPDGRSSFDKANEMIAIAYKRGSNQFEWDHRRLDGEVFPVEVTLMPISLFGKQLLYCMWKDITALKRAEESLAETRRNVEQEAGKLRSMIEGMDEGIIFANADDVIIEVNGWFLAKVGLGRNDIVGKSLWEFHPDTEGTARLRAALEAFRSGQHREAFTVNRELLGMQSSLRLTPLRRS